MDASAMIMGGRTYAPARYVAETFGYNVEWDSKSKTVLINKTINQVNTEKSTETTTVVTTKAETTTKKTEVTTKKTKVPNKVETTTKKVEKSTETTTMSAQEILNSSPIEGVGATVFKLVKNDIKNAFKLYHIGNANSNNRFSQSTYNKFMEMWKSTAKTDVEKQFVSQSQIVYKSMITTCKKLDQRVGKHPASTDVRNYCEKRRETLENMISTYLASKDISAVKNNAEKIKKYASATSST
ncbi:MAG: copper amine oxidase N-terminal domain-containing protein [Eubacterium sp.]|nr:copper amine oxidase N-terminal domain-containing protein [Eubacterium sp.]